MKPYRAKLMVLPPPNETWEGGPLVLSFGRGHRLDEHAKCYAVDAHAACYITPDGDELWAAQESKGDDVRKALADASLTLVPDSEWASFRSRFTNFAGQAPSLALILLLVQHGLPLCNEKVSQIILDDTNHWRAALADMVYERDMRKYQAIVLVHKDADKKGEPVVVPRWIPHQHLKKSWFAFDNLDDAMSVKFAFPKSTLIEL